MACHRLELSHAVRTEPLSEAVDERRMVVRSVAIAGGSKLGLPRLHALGDGDREAHRLETEAGIDGFDDALELEIDETRDMRRIACRHREAEIDNAHFAIDAIKGELQASCSHAIACEGRNEILHEKGGNRDDGFLRRDGFEKLAQAAISLGGSDASKELGCTAERLIEALQKLGRKARSKGCTRLVQQGAGTLEAEPPQRRARIV